MDKKLFCSDAEISQDLIRAAPLYGTPFATMTVYTTEKEHVKMVVGEPLESFAKIPFGNIIAFDRVVRHGDSPDNKPVGRLQGLLISDSFDGSSALNIFTITLDGSGEGGDGDTGGLHGSILFQGRETHASKQYALTGTSGSFLATSGFASVTRINPLTLRFDIHLFHQAAP